MFLKFVEYLGAPFHFLTKKCEVSWREVKLLKSNSEFLWTDTLQIPFEK